MVEAIRDALADEMARDPSVVLLGEDVGRKGGVFKASEGLWERFGPWRVLDTPVAEIAIAGVAIGAAMMGLRPVAEFQFADYMHPAYDQIVNQAATVRWRSAGAWSVPVVFRAPFGAGVRGGVYHSQSPEAPYCHTPGLKVVAPATPDDAHGLLKAAIRDDDPVVFFEHKRLYRSQRGAVTGAVVPIGAPWPAPGGWSWCTRPTRRWDSVRRSPRSRRRSSSATSTRRSPASRRGTGTSPTTPRKRTPSSPGSRRSWPRCGGRRATDAPRVAPAGPGAGAGRPRLAAGEAGRAACR